MTEIKSNTTAKKTAETPALLLTLDDFCRGLSESDSRVELIAGFHMTMRLAKKLRATAADYQKAYAEFITKPA